MKQTTNPYVKFSFWFWKHNVYTEQLKRERIKKCSMCNEVFHKTQDYAWWFYSSETGNEQMNQIMIIVEVNTIWEQDQGTAQTIQNQGWTLLSCTVPRCKSRNWESRIHLQQFNFEKTKQESTPHWLCRKKTHSFWNTQLETFERTHKTVLP